MSTLYIRLPSREASGNSAGWFALACRFALLSNRNIISQQGAAPISALAETIANAQRVVLLLAASDVTLLRIKIPPLSPEKLKLALPNLIEDQLIADPADCVIVAGDSSDGLRTIAVIQRAWLKLLFQTLSGYGARHISALPAQLCLPYQPEQPGGVLAAINEHHTGIDVTLRLNEQEGTGVALSGDQANTAAHETISALCALAPEAQITLYVPQESVPAYQNEINNSGMNRINILTDNWSRWITGAADTTLDLMREQRGSGSGLNWRTWRWPLTLSAIVMLVNISALNFDWLHMKREANALRAAMFQSYKTAYPNETVIIDPIAQMRQKITAAKRNSGLAAPDDFTAIMAAFGEALAGAATASAITPAIASFEYRERALIVKFKPGSAVPTQQMHAALALRNLSLEQLSSQSSAVAWEIRSAK